MEQTTEYIALVNEAKRALLDQSVTAITDGIKETVDVDDAAEVWQSIIDRLFVDYGIKPRNPFLTPKYRVVIDLFNDSTEFDIEYDGDADDLENDIRENLEIEAEVNYSVRLNIGNTNELFSVYDSDGDTVDVYRLLQNYLEVTVTKI